MNSFVRRAAFALAFLDYNVLGSGAINDDSQMLWVRGINDRLEKLAPFLSYDGDPYPVAVDGRVDVGRRRATRRPPATRTASGSATCSASSRRGLDDNDNYVRNSVKAVVDAYDGAVTFYVVDDQDPILEAWRSAFPNLFTPVEQMPEELREHLRYPEDLFRVQTDIYSKYQIDPALFFEREGGLVGGPGAELDADERRTARSDAGVGRRHGHRRRADVRLRVRRRPVHAVLHGVRHDACPASGEERVRAPAAVRAVLDQRPAHRAAGVHDRLERPGRLRQADDAISSSRATATARRAAARGQQRRVDRGDLAPDLARQRRRRRIAGALRRPADRPGRRRADLRPAVLRVGAAESPARRAR